MPAVKGALVIAGALAAVAYVIGAYQRRLESGKFSEAAGLVGNATAGIADGEPGKDLARGFAILVRTVTKNDPLWGATAQYSSSYVTPSDEPGEPIGGGIAWGSQGPNTEG